jgi:hypothetical protein
MACLQNGMGKVKALPTLIFIAKSKKQSRYNSQIAKNNLEAKYLATGLPACNKLQVNVLEIQIPVGTVLAYCYACVFDPHLMMPAEMA